MHPLEGYKCPWTRTKLVFLGYENKGDIHGSYRYRNNSKKNPIDFIYIQHC